MRRWPVIGAVAGALSLALLGDQLSDRIGDRRPVALAGALSFVAGFVVLVAAPPTLATVIAGVALIALGEGILDPSLAAWAGDSAAPDTAPGGPAGRRQPVIR